MPKQKKEKKQVKKKVKLSVKQKPAKKQKSIKIVMAKPVRKKAKPVRKRAKPKKTVAKQTGVNSLDFKIKELSSQITITRSQIMRNESVLGVRIFEKIKAEDSLGQILKASFLAEKQKLAALRSGTAKKQASLKQRISSLEKIEGIYEEKKAKIKAGKKKQVALKRQLDLLEKNAGALGPNA